MQYRSFFINLNNKSCYVIGGGKQAAQISKSLLEDQALVTVWNEDFSNELINLSKEYPRQLNLLQAEFTLEVAEHYCSARVKPFIVITALSDPEANQAICEICQNNNVLSYYPGNSSSEVLITENSSIEPLELAVIAKGYPELSRNLQKKLDKIIENDWLPAIRSYVAYAESEETSQMDKAEKRIFFRRLASELIKSNGDFEQALSEAKVYYNNLQEKDDLLLELADERSLMD